MNNSITRKKVVPAAMKKAKVDNEKVAPASIESKLDNEKAATTAIASMNEAKLDNENHLVLAMAAIESIAGETILIVKSIDSINEKIALIKSLGFTSIQSGLGKTDAVPGELPYKSFRAACIDKFAGQTGRLLTGSIRDLRQSINYGLSTDKPITDSNYSRTKRRAKQNAKTGTAGTTSAAAVFDAVKICARLTGKYNKKQVTAIIIELQKLIA